MARSIDFGRTAFAAAAVLALALLACKKDEEKSPEPAAAAEPAAPAPTPAEPTAEEPAAEQPAEPPAAEKPELDEKGIPAIPDGRSKPPTVDEWKTATAVNTQGGGSQAQDCEMKILREWIKVHCEGDVKSISHKEGLPQSNADYFESIKLGKFADFVFRLKKGRTTQMRIHRDGNRASLFINWPASKDRPVHVALAHKQE